jgi:ABC-type transport system substrate-binding protein
VTLGWSIAYNTELVKNPPKTWMDLTKPEYKGKQIAQVIAPSGGTTWTRAMFERVEWLAIPDPATQAAALSQGEIDFIESPTLELVPMLKARKDVQVKALWPTGSEGTMRINWTNPPFDNPIARRAIYNFVSQPDMIMAVLGDPAEANITIMDDEAARATGLWSEPLPSEVVPVHAHLLPDPFLFQLPLRRQTW